LEKEAYRRKNQINKLWKRSLNYRKQHFWNTYKCEQYAKIYKHWISKDIPIVPRKYLIKEIKGEPQEETELHWNLMIKKFETDINH